MSRQVVQLARHLAGAACGCVPAIDVDVAMPFNPIGHSSTFPVANPGPVCAARTPQTSPRESRRIGVRTVLAALAAAALLSGCGVFCGGAAASGGAYAGGCGTSVRF
ncbi:hypothetical protein EVC45_23760 [Paraburkholderia sp. UYCP14C]|nr:hypothetical protein EVC45_23760 [Paraburkholderia sp. UYCP14C]